MKGGQIQGIKVAGMEVTVVTRQQAMRGRWTASRCAARPVDLLGSCRSMRRTPLVVPPESRLGGGRLGRSGAGD